MEEIRNEFYDMDPADYTDEISEVRIRQIRAIMEIIDSGCPELSEPFFPDQSLLKSDNCTVAHWLVGRLQACLTDVARERNGKLELMCFTISDEKAREIIEKTNTTCEEIRRILTIARNIDLVTLVKVGATRNLIKHM